MAGYADLDDVREELVQGLKTDTFKVAATGPALAATIQLPDRTTEAIVEVKVNGTATAGYTFDGVDTLTFSPVLNVGDGVRVVRDTKVSDERIEKDNDVITLLIDGMLGARFDVPFASGQVPPLIVSAANALTAMRIRERLFGSTGNTPGDPHALREWDQWMMQLQAIASGETVLRDADGEPTKVVNRGIVTNTRNTKPIFSLEEEPDISAMPRNRDYPDDTIDGFSS